MTPAWNGWAAGCWGNSWGEDVAVGQSVSDGAASHRSAIRQKILADDAEILELLTIWVTHYGSTSTMLGKRH